MTRESRLDDVYRSIGTGVMADKALIAVARFQKLRQIGEQEKRDLELAKEYLRQAADGPAALEKKPLSDTSLERALALDEATEAILLELPRKKQEQPHELLGYLTTLLNTLDNIIVGSVPSDEDLADVRAFFASLGRFTANRTAMMVMPDVQQEVSLW